MTVFSTNQVRQLYVANAVPSTGANTHVVATDNIGTISVQNDTAKNHLYFEYRGADNLMRSDLIDIKNILWAKATDAAKMSHELKSVLVKLDTDVNDGNPVAGQDYILRIAFRQFIGISDADQYFKYGMVHAYAGMAAEKFYAKLALSLVQNFSRELTPLVKFYLESGADSKTYDEVTPATKEDALTKKYTGIVIEEVEQPWKLGKVAQTPVYFEVQPTTIIVDGDERIWGKVEDAELANSVNNGKAIADLEYFCMGERGDMYRGVGYPNDITTTYLVDPSKPYYTLDLHYAYVGSNEGAQKSEKDITIVSADKAELNKIITAINTATGLNIATIA